MKKALFIILFFPLLLSAQTAGEAGYSFLKIGFGARSIALSDLGVTGSNDVSGVYYNPALVQSVGAGQILVGHNAWIQDLSSQMLGASFNFWGLQFALTLNTTSIDNIEIHPGPWETESTFNAHYFFTGLSTGIQIYNDISAGITVKYLYENLFSDESDGIGYDFGIDYKNALNNLDLGVSLRNLGSVSELRNVKTKLPVDLRIGAAYKYKFDLLKSDLLLIGGYQKYMATKDSHLHAGAEFIYDGFIAFRTGYVTGYDAKNVSAGLGLFWNNLNFDYAFTNFDMNLGSAHTVSLMYSFE